MIRCNWIARLVAAAVVAIGVAAPAKLCIGGWSYGGRSFLTKEEKLAMLKEYKEDLEKEVAGVEERIKELSAKSLLFFFFCLSKDPTSFILWVPSRASSTLIVFSCNSCSGISRTEYVPRFINCVLGIWRIIPPAPGLEGPSPLKV